MVFLLNASNFIIQHTSSFGIIFFNKLKWTILPIRISIGNDLDFEHFKTLAQMQWETILSFYTKHTVVRWQFRAIILNYCVNGCHRLMHFIYVVFIHTDFDTNSFIGDYATNILTNGLARIRILSYINSKFLFYSRINRLEHPKNRVSNLRIIVLVRRFSLYFNLPS